MHARLLPAVRPAGSLLLLLVASCGGGGGSTPATPTLDPQQAKLQLGFRLMFDEDLSRPSGMACGTCHDPQLGWGDDRPQGKGIQDNTLGTGDHDGALAVEGFRWKTLLTGRNTPTVYNSFLYPNLFWDGRAGDLAHQAGFPVEGSVEMNSDWDQHVLPLLASDPEYVELFETAFGPNEVTRARATEALGAYEATISVFDTPFDDFLAGDANALSDAEKRGHDLFFDKARCHICHPAPLLTDFLFHNLGVPSVGTFALNGEVDLGHGKFVDHTPLPEQPGIVVDVPSDYAKFKTPQLRMLAVTGPYMHNGALLTLEDLVDFYDVGGGPDLSGTGTKPVQLEVLGLTPQEKADLVAFLRSGLQGTEIK